MTHANRFLSSTIYTKCHAITLPLYNQFLQNSGRVEISSSGIKVFMKKKRSLPTLLAAMEKFQGISLPTHQGKTLHFCADNTS